MIQLQSSQMSKIRNFFKRGSSTRFILHKCTIQEERSESYLPRTPENASACERFCRWCKKKTLISDDNPRSLEFYRSTTEIHRVRKEHVRSNSNIIHPFSEFRVYYEMWMALIWCMILFYFPLDGAFDLVNDNFQYSSLDEYKYVRKTEDYFGLFLRLVGLVDIVMTFFTGYPVEKMRKVIMQPRRIAKKYVLCIYFFIDLLTSLPLQFLTSKHHTQRILDFISFLRIVRLKTLDNYLTTTIDYFGINNMTIRVIKITLINFLMFNWFACLQFLIPQLRYFINGDILPESWIERADLPQYNRLTKYIICMYRAAGSLFCIDFEESPLELWEEMLLTVLTFIFGKVYFFYIVVLVLNFLLTFSSLEVKYFEIVSQVETYMSRHQLPIPMQKRLLQFYEYKYNKKFFKERSIIGLLSDKLKGEINVSVCSNLVQNVSLLGQLPQNVLEQLVVHLKSEVFLPHDVIIKAGSVGDYMYFLASGTVAVWTPSGKEVCHLEDGAYFGEISLVFKDKRRTANIIALEICEVYKLDRRGFRNCFKTDPYLLKLLEDIANERMEITQAYEEAHAKTFLEL